MSDTLTGTVSVPNFSPPTAFNSSNPITIPLPFANTPVTWSAASLPRVPTTITGVPLSTLITNSNQPNSGYSVDAILTLTITGTSNVQVILGGLDVTPQVFLVYSYPNTTTFRNFQFQPTFLTQSGFGVVTYTYRYNFVNAQEPTATHNVTGANTLDIPNSVQLSVVSSINSPTTEFTLSQSLAITVTVACTSESALIGGFCTGYCGINQDKCFPEYLSACFPTNQESAIATDTTVGESCRTFLSGYLQFKGAPQATLDTALDTYCQTKYPNGFSQLFNGGTSSRYGPITPQERLNDQNICACHMQRDQYDAYYNQITTGLPYGGQLLSAAGNEFCLFQPCNSSSFKSTGVGGLQCPTVQCLNLAGVEFGSTGAISGPISISQNENCPLNLSNSPTAPTPNKPSAPPTTPAPPTTTPTPPTTTPSPPTTSTSSLSITAVVIGLILIVAIIVIIIALLSRNRKTQ